MAAIEDRTFKRQDGKDKVTGLGRYTADLQLTRFKADPSNKGKVLDTGLWRYSRHPNYFGECCVWAGFALIALEVPWGWIGFVSPALMAWAILGMMGKELLERRMLKKRPDYQDYVRRTSGGRAAVGLTDSEGRFVVRYSEVAAGAAVGPSVVSFAPRPEAAKFPKELSRTFEVEVQQGKNNFEFELRKPPRKR